MICFSFSYCQICVFHCVVKIWFLAVGRWLGKGELKVFSHGFKIPGCLNASLLSQFTASHRILFKVIVRFLAFAFLGVVKSQPAQVKALSGDVNRCSQVIYLVDIAKNHSCVCCANVALVFCSFLHSKYQKAQISYGKFYMLPTTPTLFPVSSTCSQFSYLSYLIAQTGKAEVLKSRVH